MKILAALLSFMIIMTPITSYAGDLVKEVPEKYQQILGENYVLIDLEYLTSLDVAVKELDVFKKTLDETLFELDKFKKYSISLEDAIKIQENHIVLLNTHIDSQEKIIANLRPTFWDKNKFTFGVLLGGVAVGGMAYGLSTIN